MKRFIALLLILTSLHSNENRQKLLNIFAGEWLARASYVAAKLEIADHLGSEIKTIHELSDLTSSDPQSLYRLMRLLASHDIFTEHPKQSFSNNATSHLLQKEGPDSLHAIALFYGEDMHDSWDNLLPCIEQGKPAFELTFNKPVFRYFKENPKRAQLFQKAMKSKTKSVINSTLATYDFNQFEHICDVGGGYGHFLNALLTQYPSLRGTLFELPEVAKTMSKHTPFQTLSGDFFQSVPCHSDAYILKSVLHDWNDDQALQILRNCTASMHEKSKLLIIEVVLLPGDQSKYANCMDLLMLAVTGGKERSLMEFERLFDQSDLKLTKIYQTETEFSILEVVKK
ncbi:MAG: hypothetical protein MRY21_01660 [Simkaniaceae bacterium]|nr:hypothetical protein [Simkaniaceae bacterium]